MRRRQVVAVRDGAPVTLGQIAEVRDTLYDLRTDVTDSQSLSSTLQAFLDRVRDRSGLDTHLRSQETGRLPILQERELWRIAQEAGTHVGGLPWDKNSVQRHLKNVTYIGKIDYRGTVFLLPRE